MATVVLEDHLHLQMSDLKSAVMESRQPAKSETMETLVITMAAAQLVQ